MAGGQTRPPLGYRSWSAHLLGRGHPHQVQSAPYDLRDSEREFQPRARKLWIIFKEEAPALVVIAAVPQGVEFRRQVVEVEGDAVGFVSHRGTLDRPRILSGALDQPELLVVEQAELGRRREVHAGIGGLALQRADPRMRVLDVEDGIVL